MVSKYLVYLRENLLHNLFYYNHPKDNKIKMKNFIRFNRDNVKGSHPFASIQRQKLPKISNSKVKKVTKNLTINQRLNQIQNKLIQAQSSKQQQILQDLFAIKQDIRLIKSHILDPKYQTRQRQRQLTQESQGEENIYSTFNYNTNVKQRMRSQSSQGYEKPESKVHEKPYNSKMITLQEILSSKHKNTAYQKNMMNIKTINSMIKQYRFQSPQFSNIFYGYSKKNSMPVIVKYSAEGLVFVLQIYDRLWKNISKAKWTCFNRILDFKREDTSYIIMERNKGSITGLPPKSVLIDLLKILQFVHDCGYLYRNIQPEHLMINDQGQLVLIDFKRTKRYVDIKGHALEVIDSYHGSAFASNNQLRGLSESRKDDLESLGYLALLLLQLQIPWYGCSKQQAIKIRCSLTLQQLFRNNSKWVQYMANVMKTNKGQRPDYKRLIEILQLS